MKAQILYTTAINESGKLIHIDDAEKGKAYYCPICKQKLILRKSGKSGTGSRRPHFAHNELTSNCTPEGVLHLSFKRLLAEKLNAKIENNKPFEIRWICHYCGRENAGNLLAKVKCIKEEYDLIKCKPDLALLDENNNVIAAIEIVVTHMPEDSTIKYYKENGIALIRIDLESDEDLKQIDEKIICPSWVEYCDRTNCRICDDIKSLRKIVVTTIPCGRCLAQIENYAIEVDSIFGTKCIADFSDSEIELIKEVNKRIEIKEDAKTKDKRPVSVCRNCLILRSRYQRRRF